MSLEITLDQKHRYRTDPDYHAKVELVSRALWVAAWYHEHSCRPYPYEWLIPATKEDLTAYAMAAVEAIEHL